MVKRGTPAFFSFFGRIQKRCHETSKMKKRDTPRLFVIFVAHSKAVSLNAKNGAEGHRASFCHFCGAFEAVSLNTKNGEERHRALVKHGNACAGECHQLVGHQMNEQVRHRAVQALEGEPGKVARAGADVSGILGTRSVGKPAMKLWRRPTRPMSMLRTVSS